MDSFSMSVAFFHARISSIVRRQPEHRAFSIVQMLTHGDLTAGVFFLKRKNPLHHRVFFACALRHFGGQGGRRGGSVPPY